MLTVTLNITALRIKVAAVSSINLVFNIIVAFII